MAKNRAGYSVLLLAAWLLAASIAPAEQHYRVTVDESLSTLAVTARFDTPVTSIRARDWDAARYIDAASDCGNRRLRVRRRSLSIPGDGIRCLSYRVDLERAAEGERRNRYLDPANVSLSPSLWLWRPRVSGDDAIDVSFELPNGVSVAVPWRPVAGEDNRYRLVASPESAHAPALFGRFAYHELPVGGARLRVALAQGDADYDENEILSWISATATDVTLAYGRFPHPSPFVLVLPVSSERRWGRSPVPFGRVIRDGGEAIELFVDPQGRHEDFMSDWTATHEFSHMMLPYLASSARWISEGFAQYYQNVLLARSGAYDERSAWQKIVAGLERGRAARPDLSPNEAAAERRRGARMKIYWSGAALALMADVELRRRSNGRDSLDAVLDRLQRCCLPSAKVWSGPEFFAQLDALTDWPVFVDLYREYADEAGFPDARPLLASLGVVEGRRLADDRELSALRRDIMRRREDVAEWREGLMNSP